MKLLSVTARANLIGIVVVLIASASILFISLRFVVLEELHEQLTLKAQRIESAISSGHEFYDPFTSIQELSGADVSLGEDVFSDTLIYDDTQNEYEDYRMLETVRNVDGRLYRIKTATSRVEWEEFLGIIFAVFLGISALLLIVMQIINQRLTRKIWTPFFTNLKRVQSFSLQSKELIQFEESSVQEFTELNEVLERMTSKVQQDYGALKDFTENASHEIQTPLAVILSGLDQLGQSPTLDEAAAARIETIKGAATRLSKLNRNLLLLTKIENRQFSTAETLNLKKVLSSHLEMMEDLFATKKILPTIEIEETLSVKADPALLDILIGNLLANAYRHSENGAQVNVTSEANHLVFSNTGKPLSVDAEKLFERFYKSSTTASSQGLGLAIVKQICELYGWEISYSRKEGRHCFVVGFK